MRRQWIVLLALVALVVAACGGGSGGAEEPATTAAAAAVGDPARGEELFQGTCVACHGADATGIEGLGKDLANSDFIRGMTDAELATFIKGGRPSSDPANTTGVDMPPKGGNPALSDQDLLDIASFLRSLQ
jgi:disulfide bond formation protein DsbB